MLHYLCMYDVCITSKRQNNIIILLLGHSETSSNNNDVYQVSGIQCIVWPIGANCWGAKAEL